MVRSDSQCQHCLRPLYVHRPGYSFNNRFVCSLLLRMFFTTSVVYVVGGLGALHLLCMTIRNNTYCVHKKLLEIFMI